MQPLPRAAIEIATIPREGGRCKASDKGLFTVGHSIQNPPQPKSDRHARSFHQETAGESTRRSKTSRLTPSTSSPAFRMIPASYIRRRT
jgi:hypothetical protein